MQKAYLEAGLGGLAAALLGTVLPLRAPDAALFSLFAGMPIIAIGLLHGLSMASVAGGVAIGIALVLAGIPGLILQGFMVSAPAVLIGGLLGQAALISSSVSQRHAAFGTALGLIGTWFIGMLTLAMVVASGSEGGLAGVLNRHASQVINEMMVVTNMPQLQDMLRMVHVIPGFMAVGLITILLVNVGFAQMLRRTRMGSAPSLGFSNLRLPTWIIDAMIVAALGSFLSGWPGFLAQNALIILLFIVTVGGISVVHALLRDVPARAAALIVFYLMLIMIPLAPLLLWGLGLAEHWVGVRRRFAPSPTEEE